MIDTELVRSFPRKVPSSRFFASVVFCVLIATAYFVYLSARTPLTQTPPQFDFLLHTNTYGSWYTFVPPARVRRIAAPASFVSAAGVTPVEETHTLAFGAVPALVRSGPNPTVSAFGLIEPNGAFHSLTHDPFQKEGLAVNTAGTRVAYAALETSGQPPHLSAVWRITLYDFSSTTMPTAIDLGTGLEPRFLPNGDILAATSAGIVDINTNTKERTVVLKNPVFIPNMYAASPDGSYVAVVESATSTVVYIVHRAAPVTLKKIGVLSYPAVPLAFFPNGQFIAAYLTVAGTLGDFMLYDISSRGISLTGHIATSSPASL